ncbi:MAG: glutamate 5-kinase [Atopobiaceae bacterium]|nr:glutamate 5-kinase [Atopobiaceae bacterium]
MSDATNQLVVVKIGSNVLVDDAGVLDKDFIADISAQLCRVIDAGWRVVLVTSGAVAAGMSRLGLSSRPSDLPSLQAAASAGQAAVIETYAEALLAHGRPCGQILLTRGDTADRSSYLNARNTMERLIEMGAIPIVNENDTVTIGGVAETFGDNDMLGAVIAALMGANLYVILSDVEGLYTKDPSKDADARLIPEVHEVTDDILSLAGGAGSEVGTGGMATKVRAGRAMLTAGIPMVVCKGRCPSVLVDLIVEGHHHGTRFTSDSMNSESARKLWIGLAGISKGRLVVDDGAASALRKGGGSLLPVGVVSVQGAFEAGDIVSVVDSSGSLVGRGFCRYDCEELEKARGLRLEVIGRFLPERAGQPCIHRDEMLVF